jgi:hypothetical protein
MILSKSVIYGRVQDDPGIGMVDDSLAGADDEVLDDPV